MASKSVLIRVPSTVGNFGGAVNCAALALDAPLNVKVTPRLDGHVGIRYFGENGERVPRDRSNLVVRAMEAALHLRGLEFTGADFEIYSSVPVAVGLGSSAAAIWAGLIAADRLFRLELDEKTLFDLAAIYESRGDNLRAAWYGGFVARAEGGDALGYQRTVVPENLTLSVVIPEISLALGRAPAARRAPAQDPSWHFRRAAGFAEFFARPGTAHTPSLEAAFHPTDDKVVPGLEDALKVERSGLLAVFVCGSGPAVGILAPGEAADSASAVSGVQECFARSGTTTRRAEFRPTNSGARERNAVHADVHLPPSRGLSVSLQKAATNSV
jgi:homoserine kinase